MRQGKRLPAHRVAPIPRRRLWLLPPVRRARHRWQRLQRHHSRARPRPRQVARWSGPHRSVQLRWLRAGWPSPLPWPRGVSDVLSSAAPRPVFRHQPDARRVRPVCPPMRARTEANREVWKPLPRIYSGGVAASNKGFARPVDRGDREGSPIELEPSSVRSLQWKARFWIGPPISAACQPKRAVSQRGMIPPFSGHSPSSGRKDGPTVRPAQVSIGNAMANRRSSRCDCRRCFEMGEAAPSRRQTASRCGVPASPSGGRPSNTAAAAHG